jgi:hypothetical protein
MVVDVDVKNGENDGLTLPDLLDRVKNAGLPLPSLVVQTPSGGFHVYWHYKKPIYATDKAIEVYHDIQRAVADEIGADHLAIGAERWFRLPRASNTVWTKGEPIQATELLDWMLINREEESLEPVGTTYQGDLLKHPAFQLLLRGVSEGKRDHACYTLALALKKKEHTQDQALKFLLEWNQKNEPPMSEKRVYKKVYSAYRGKYHAPSQAWVSQLTGIPFAYIINKAKRREDRQRSHYDELEQDFLEALKKAKGELLGSQRKIAEELGMAYSSFKIVKTRLEEAGDIQVHVKRRGRGAKTIISLADQDSLRNENEGKGSLSLVSSKRLAQSSSEAGVEDDERREDPSAENRESERSAAAGAVQSSRPQTALKLPNGPLSNRHVSRGGGSAGGRRAGGERARPGRVRP